MLRKYGHLLATSISSSLHVCLLWPRLEGAHRDWWVSDLTWQPIPHSCTAAALVKLTNLSFWLCQNRCLNWGWKTSPTNVNAVWSWIPPLQPAASRCREWLALFYVADMRQLQAGVIANFHMAKLLVWKGHQKEKIKKFRTMWKEKETATWSRSGFRGAAGLSPSLPLAEDFIPDPFTLQPAAYYPQCSPSSSVCLLSSPHLFASVVVVVLFFFSITR